MTASNIPVSINTSTWFYVEETCIDIISEPMNATSDGYHRIKIPLKLLRSSLARIAVKPKRKK